MMPKHNIDKYLKNCILSYFQIFMEN